MQMSENHHRRGDVEAGNISSSSPRRRRRRRFFHPPPVSGARLSDSDDDQSWHSPLNSVAGGESYDECCAFSGASVSGIEGLSDPQSDSSFSYCSFEVDLESGGAGELKACLAKSEPEMDCRICKLSLVEASQESGVLIELGCSCKGDLGAAHDQCAQTWFQTRGNTICEICGVTAANVPTEHLNEAYSTSTASTMAAPEEPTNLAEPQSFWHRRRIMNMMLACMVFAFIVSWFFHFHAFSRTHGDRRSFGRL